MEHVSIDDAKIQLDTLIQRAQRGEDVRIAAANGASIRLQPVETGAFKTRVPGRLAGRLAVPEDVFAPLSDDELRRWDGTA